MDENSLTLWLDVIDTNIAKEGPTKFVDRKSSVASSVEFKTP